jgi:predicted nucleic acid-binding protein
MNLLFDTNIIIAFLKNDKPVVDLFQKQKYINISSVTVGEMLYGALNSKKSNENIKLYKDFFAYCKIYKIDEKTSEYYAKI